MDMHVYESLQMIHVLLLSLFYALFLRTGIVVTFPFIVYVCTLIMRFSSIYDFRRATHSFFHIEPQTQKDKISSAVIHLLPVSEFTCL